MKICTRCKNVCLSDKDNLKTCKYCRRQIKIYVNARKKVKTKFNKKKVKRDENNKFLLKM